MGKEREHIRKVALYINGYPEWIFEDSRLADQHKPGVEENDEEKEDRVPVTT